MSEFRCTECRDVAPELALDVLTGRTRARAVAHLSDCAPCLEMVSSLALVADRLVELLPEVEPPAGFGDRVVTRVALSEEPASRRPVPVASALVTLLLTAIAWALGVNGGGAGDWTGHTGVRQPTVLYAPLKVGDQQVGGAFLYSGDPGWIHVSLHTDLLPPDGTVRCDVVGPDGTTGVVGEFRMAGGRAEWEGLIPIDTRSVSGATVADLAGRTVSTARFDRVSDSAPRPRSARPVPSRPAGLTDGVGGSRGHPEAPRSESDGGDIERDTSRTAPSPDHPRPGADRDTSRTAPSPDHPRPGADRDTSRTAPGKTGPDPGHDQGRRASGPARTGSDPGAGGADRGRGHAEARPHSPRPAVRSASPSRARRAPAPEPDRRAQRTRTESSSGEARSRDAAGGGSRVTRAPERRPAEVRGTDRNGRGRTADTARSGTGARDVGRNAPRDRPPRSADSSDDDD